jgi:hypothetical protein
MDITETTAFRAGKIAGDTGASGMLVAIMDRNAREADRTYTRVVESLEHDRDEWRERALTAERELSAAKFRLVNLVFGKDW